MALLGPSGAGKTTLLRLVAGLEQPDRGRILFQGRDITGIPPHQRSFGMMFQEYALFPHRDVAANIAFGLEMQKMARHQRDKRVSEVVELVGLHGFDRRSVDSLSGGERQRVALARCLAPRPRLLLLDEPLASLDLQLRERLANEIRTILKRLAITAIFVTHDQSEAFAVADRIAILHQGRLEQCATPEEIYRHPASAAVATFLGFQNLFSSTTGNLHNLLPAVDDWLPFHQPAAAADQGKILLIRPDAASLAGQSPQETDAIILDGVVERRRFQGRFYQLTIAVQAHRLVFDMPPEPLPPGPGEAITFRLDPAAIALLRS
jgi:ABC-type Fe3+/spermidine/putrescine transport system ATPase subunit